MRVTAIAMVVLAALGAAAPQAQVSASFDTARELYASAEYEGALGMLDGLLAGDYAGEERQSMEMYRVLCLVATGREVDAEGAIEALVTRDPLYRPADDLPPRVRTAYLEARTRLLPAAIQTGYQQAKAAFDVKDYVAAERAFGRVLEVMADPDVATLVAQSPLSDLRTLATGFQELAANATAAAAAPPAAVNPAPDPVPPPLSTAVPLSETIDAGPPPLSAAADPVPDPPPAATPAPGPEAVPPLAGATVAPAPRAVRVYSSDDRNVVPPIAIMQYIPAFPGPIRVEQSGVVEVLIDVTGAVESATMAASLGPQYDRLALTAARSWLYRPARLDGVPVKFLKRIQLNIVPARE